jgi:hypothetical protein
LDTIYVYLRQIIPELDYVQFSCNFATGKELQLFSQAE